MEKSHIKQEKNHFFFILARKKGKVKAIWANFQKEQPPPVAKVLHINPKNWDKSEKYSIKGKKIWRNP